MEGEKCAENYRKVLLDHLVGEKKGNMATHARYTEVIQGTETKPCSHPPAEQLNPDL